MIPFHFWTILLLPRVLVIRMVLICKLACLLGNIPGSFNSFFLFLWWFYFEINVLSLPAPIVPTIILYGGTIIIQKCKIWIGGGAPCNLCAFPLDTQKTIPEIWPWSFYWRQLQQPVEMFFPLRCIITSMCLRRFKCLVHAEGQGEALYSTCCWTRLHLHLLFQFSIPNIFETIDE